MTVFNRDHKRRPPILPPETWPLALLILLIMLASSGCATATHNAAGGYVEACGELPGMLGDDC